MCPVCGAPKGRFEEWVEEDSSKLINDSLEEEEDDLYEDYEV
jgi:hypothetical protein